MVDWSICLPFEAVSETCPLKGFSVNTGLLSFWSVTIIVRSVGIAFFPPSSEIA